jgi:PhnB protein
MPIRFQTLEHPRVNPVPEGLHTITPALAIDGCAEAIEFYKTAFGAVELMRAPDPSGKKIWHAMMRIGNSSFFLNDVFPEMGGGPVRARIWLYLDGVDAAFKRATDAGAAVRMPLGDMFWGDRLGTVTDKWGNEWTIAQHVKDVTPEEMHKAMEAFGAKA